MSNETRSIPRNGSELLDATRLGEKGFLEIEVGHPSDWIGSGSLFQKVTVIRSRLPQSLGSQLQPRH